MWQKSPEDGVSRGESGTCATAPLGASSGWLSSKAREHCLCSQRHCRIEHFCSRPASPKRGGTNASGQQPSVQSIAAGISKFNSAAGLPTSRFLLLGQLQASERPALSRSQCLPIFAPTHSTSINDGRRFQRLILGVSGGSGRLMRARDRRESPCHQIPDIRQAFARHLHLRSLVFRAGFAAGCRKGRAGSGPQPCCRLREPANAPKVPGSCGIRRYPIAPGGPLLRGTERRSGSVPVGQMSDFRKTHARARAPPKAGYLRWCDCFRHLRSGSRAIAGV